MGVFNGGSSYIVSVTPAEAAQKKESLRTEIYRLRLLLFIELPPCARTRGVCLRSELQRELFVFAPGLTKIADAVKFSRERELD